MDSGYNMVSEGNKYRQTMTSDLEISATTSWICGPKLEVNTATYPSPTTTHLIACIVNIKKGCVWDPFEHY